MKLLTYRINNRECLGIVVEGVVLDLKSGLSILGYESAYVPDDMTRFLEQGEQALTQAQQLVEAYLQNLQRFEGVVSPLSQIEYLPPVPRPQKILAIGANYRAHCEESRTAIPARPLVFTKVPSALVGHGQPIVYPHVTSELDYEGELALVIGRRARNVAEEDAFRYIAGYTIMNDVTARDLQRTEGQWARAKGCDTFAPCGPWLVTADEIPDPHALTIRTLVNGETRQHASTGDMIFRIPTLIAHISAAMTLYPGDIITTGTPAGVGVYRKPSGLLKVGDEVVVHIEGIGELRNTVVAEA